MGSEKKTKPARLASFHAFEKSSLQIKYLFLLRSRLFIFAMSKFVMNMIFNVLSYSMSQGEKVMEKPLNEMG